MSIIAQSRTATIGGPFQDDAGYRMAVSGIRAHGFLPGAALIRSHRVDSPTRWGRGVYDCLSILAELPTARVRR